MAPLTFPPDSFLVMADLDMVAWKSSQSGDTIRRKREDHMQLAVRELGESMTSPMRVLKITSPTECVVRQ